MQNSHGIELIFRNIPILMSKWFVIYVIISLTEAILKQNFQIDLMTEILYDIDDLVQDCSFSIANALEILQSCTKPSK